MHFNEGRVDEPMNGMTIEIRREWDGALMQTADLTPERSVAVLLDFPLDLEAGDGDLPPVAAKALAEGLTASGTVAGRWLDESAGVPVDAMLWPTERQTLLERIVRQVGNSLPAPVVTTRSPAVVFELLNVGWNMQSQALLVFGPEGASASEAVQALSVNRAWTSFAFPAPARALIAPGVDGDFVLVAAATEEGLSEVLGCLVRAFRAAGFSVSGGGAGNL